MQGEDEVKGEVERGESNKMLAMKAEGRLVVGGREPARRAENRTGMEVEGK